LLKELKGEQNRGAQFTTVIALVLDGEQHYFEGRIRGTITGSPQGDSGFGYDPVFVPENSSRTFAEMTPEEKNSISHRALALRALATFLHARTGDK
jgi:XTP/dITP diphosphohydrolase